MSVKSPSLASGRPIKTFKWWLDDVNVTSARNKFKLYLLKRRIFHKLSKYFAIKDRFYAQVFSVLLLVHPLAIPTNDFLIFNLNHRNNDATVILKSCNAA